MHITITAVAIGANRSVEIANHRESHARITGKILPETQASGSNSLIAAADLLQLATILPEPVQAWLQSANAMDVKIELYEPCASEISKERLGSDSQNG